GDIARLQALYGARQADAYEGSTGNGTLGTATRLDLLADANGVLSVGVDADLTTRSDADVYRFTAPSLTGGLVIQLQHAGLSLLPSKVTVYDGAGRVVGSAFSTDPLGDDLTIKLGNVTPLGTYYVKVQGDSGDVFDVGS